VEFFDTEKITIGDIKMSKVSGDQVPKELAKAVSQHFSSDVESNAITHFLKGYL
jgi:hypothetical protein